MQQLVRARTVMEPARSLAIGLLLHPATPAKEVATKLHEANSRQIRTPA